jgi:cell division septation protein DedD
MAASVDSESEILLGNKQLLAVFAVVALLLAVAFTGGYMLGKGSAEKKGAAVGAGAAGDGSTGGLTSTVTPDDSTQAKAPPLPVAQTPPPAVTARVETPPTPKPVVAKKVDGANEGDRAGILGGPKHASFDAASPAPGGTFLQVMAVARPQAEATADVLRSKKYHARIAPKPGSSTIFRVLVGPVKDAGDLASIRNSLREIGFRDVIVQRY